MKFKQYLLIVALSFSTISHSYENKWDCILEQMPDVANDIAAKHILNECNKNHPLKTRSDRECEDRQSKMEVIGYRINTCIKTIYPPKKKPLFWEPQNKSECIKKFATKTQSNKAAKYIRYACFNWYPD